MFLTRLALRGFKSYSELVRVDFSRQIAVIIGSNGVGKSNALEAILWALGEVDPGVLRVTQYDDLLFAGSKLAPPADQASVELVFEVDKQEISLSRSIDRSGAQGFLVQGASVRSLGEYRAALNDLGLGSALKSVIRQEQLTDFFVRTTGERKEYLGEFLATESDLAAANSSFELYMNSLISGSRGRIMYSLDGEPAAGLEVVFPDKGAKKGVMLSGGERAIVSLAMKLALFDRARSPMYLFDEIEPSLDWGRNHNMQALLKAVSQRRQLIMVTHLQSTIQMAKTVHGVRIRPDGSSWFKFHFLMDERLFKIYKCC